MQNTREERNFRCFFEDNSNTIQKIRNWIAFDFFLFLVQIDLPGGHWYPRLLLDFGSVFFSVIWYKYGFCYYVCSCFSQIYTSVAFSNQKKRNFCTLKIHGTSEELKLSKHISFPRRFFFPKHLFQQIILDGLTCGHARYQFYPHFINHYTVLDS